MSATAELITQNNMKPHISNSVNVPMSDFGCYITVINKLNSILKFNSSTDPDGSWDPDPPGTISANSTVTIHLRDPSGPTGSKGSFIYDIFEPGKPPASLESSFDCPYGSDNDFEAQITGAGNADFKVAYAPPSDGGHPFHIAMTVSYA